MKLQSVAAAMPFAQLLGLAKRAEDDEDPKRARRAEEDGDDDGDEESRKAKSKVDGAEDDDEDDGDEEARKAKRAKAADDDEDPEGEDDEDREDDDADGKKSRKAKSKGKRAEDDEEEDGGDDGDEEGRKAKSARSAIRRERARCAKIIAHGVAGGSVRQACVLAFDTGMGVKAAIASLNACKADGAGASSRPSLHDRMARAGIQNVGADSDGGAPSTMTKVAAAIIAAGEKARGEPARK